MAEKGTISINAENIMPVIKKWLYSDKDIFVREVVSNGCDAVSKMKRLLSMGEAKQMCIRDSLGMAVAGHVPHLLQTNGL